MSELTCVVSDPDGRELSRDRVVGATDADSLGRALMTRKGVVAEVCFAHTGYMSKVAICDETGTELVGQTFSPAVPVVAGQEWPVTFTAVTRRSRR